MYPGRKAGSSNRISRGRSIRADLPGRSQSEKSSRRARRARPGGAQRSTFGSCCARGRGTWRGRPRERSGPGAPRGGWGGTGRAGRCPPVSLCPGTSPRRVPVSLPLGSPEPGTCPSRCPLTPGAALLASPVAPCPRVPVPRGPPPLGPCRARGAPRVPPGIPGPCQAGGAGDSRCPCSPPGALARTGPGTFRAGRGDRGCWGGAWFWRGFLPSLSFWLPPARSPMPWLTRSRAPQLPGREVPRPAPPGAAPRSPARCCRSCGAPSRKGQACSYPGSSSR